MRPRKGTRRYNYLTRLMIKVIIDARFLALRTAYDAKIVLNHIMRTVLNTKSCRQHDRNHYINPPCAPYGTSAYISGVRTAKPRC